MVLPRGKFGQPPCHIMWLRHLGVIAVPLRVQCFQETIWRLSHLDTLGRASQACCRCCQSTQLWVESHSPEHWVSLHKSANGWKTGAATSPEVKYSVYVSKMNLSGGMSCQGALTNSLCLSCFCHFPTLLVHIRTPEVQQQTACIRQWELRR